jgi:hypothetical protein
MLLKRFMDVDAHAFMASVRPFHVDSWIEDFPGSKPTIKQKLAAVRMLYDFLVVGPVYLGSDGASART